MKRAELLVAVVVMLLLVSQPNVLSFLSNGPAVFTLFGVSLLILANRLRSRTKQT
jgi:hypothetical protein